MKNITTYIYEKLKIQADNSSACVYAYNIDKFKSEEICKALDAIREYVNKNYKTDSKDMYFYIYRDNKLNPIKYVYNDQGVVTFEEFGKNVIYKYNKNCYDEFYSSIKEYKTGVVQFFVPGLDSDFNFTVNIDNESGNIVIIFSPDKPIYYED